MLVVPADPLRPRRPDPHFADEYSAALGLGLAVGLVDDGSLAVAPAGVVGEVVYRGWMLRAGEYSRLAAAVEGAGGRMRTSPAAYRRAHELPGWYGGFAAHTPASVWTVGADVDELVGLRGRLPRGPGFVRDWVKSEKHHWHEAAFVPDLDDVDSVRAVASRFVERRADDLSGGLVLRAFEDFAGGEVRTWWVGGACVAVTPHPDTPSVTADGIATSWLEPAVAELASPFVTVDLARRSDGRWRVVEVGDGQVSGRPDSTDATTFLRAVR